MDDLLAHWPFVATTLILAMAGQVVKTTVFTKANIAKHKQRGSWLGVALWWGRKTFPLHPVAAGAVLGFVPGMPVSPGVETLAATVLYFAFAGIASTWAFSILKGLAKRQGYDIEIPRESTVPATPPGNGPGKA